jgi:hypothetical protein
MATQKHEPCPTRSGDFDASGPGRSAVRTCPDCHGAGIVVRCPGCETSYAADTGDADSIEHAGQCRWCVQYDAKASHAEAA